MRSGLRGTSAWSFSANSPKGALTAAARLKCSRGVLEKGRGLFILQSNPDEHGDNTRPETLPVQSVQPTTGRVSAWSMIWALQSGRDSFFGVARR